MKYKCHRVSLGQAEWVEKLKGEKELIWPRSIWRQWKKRGQGVKLVRAWGCEGADGEREGRQST